MLRAGFRAGLYPEYYIMLVFQSVPGTISYSGRSVVQGKGSDMVGVKEVAPDSSVSHRKANTQSQTLAT